MSADSTFSLPRPASFGAWLLAARPATLTAATAPVLVGTAVAAHEGTVLPLPGCVALLGAWLLQVASNFANDVFDYEKGADGESRLGPPRAVASGLLSPRQMRRGLAAVLVAAVLCGAVLAWQVGWPIVAIGIASLLSAVAYTGGPYPLGYHGLGDVFVLGFFGFVAVGGTSYVHLGTVPPLAWLTALAVGGLATNILVVNNLRDRESDLVAKKRTLAVRFGRTGALVEYALFTAVALATPVVAWSAGLTGPAVLLGCLPGPLLLRNFWTTRRSEGRDLNVALVSTARAVFIYAACLSGGIVWDAGLSL